MVLILGVLLGPECARAQSTETQQLSLEQGENFVSLRVQPEDASLSTIFQGHLDQIHRVKDERGRVYMPGGGIEQFTTWDADESYKVYTTGSFSMEVTGTPFSLTTATVPLEKGGNMLPFVPADPQATDDALASVSGTLVRVEDEDDQIYEPGEASSSLDSLRTGQGYVLYLNQPDTLTYTIQTATLMEALSLEGVQPGQYIRARGRDESGDGGGGVFVVTNNACETDGATCFIFDKDLTSVSNTILSGDNLPPYQLPDLQNSNVSWRSFEVRYGPDPEDVISSLHLHGHFLRTNSIIPTLNTETGAIRDGFNGRLTTLENQVGYDYDDDPDGDNGKFTYNYSYTTSDRRLERIGVINSVKPEWWGAPKADPNDPQEIDPYLRWAATKAQELRDQSGLSEIFLDLEGTYYYLHAALWPSNVTVRGVGSLDHDSDMPLKYQDGYTRATLRALPGEALYRLKSDYDRWGDPDRTRLYEGMSVSRLRPFRNIKDADNLKYQQVKVDGNVRNNMQVFNNLSDYDTPQQTLQNSGEWTAWYTIQNGNKRMKDGSTVTFEDLNVVDMGGSGISHTGQPENHQVTYETVGNVEVYNGRRNHLWYGLTGSNLDNVTLQGQFWGAPLVIDGRVVGPQNYSGFTLKNIDAGQFGYDTIVGIRGKDNPGAEVVNLDNLTVDLTDAEDSQSPLNTIRVGREGTHIDGATIEGPSSFGRQVKLFDWKVDQSKAKTRRAEMKNITVTDNGHPIKNTAPGIETIAENLTVQTAEGVSGSADVMPHELRESGYSFGYARQHRTVLKNYKYLREYTKWGGFMMESGSYPHDAFFIGGEVNNNAGGLHKGYNGRGRIYLEDFTFNMGGGKGYHAPLSPDGLLDFQSSKTEVIHIQLRNCTGDFGGGDTRPSENSGTYTTGASDEGQDYVDIDPNLLSLPWARSATVTSGTPSVTGVDAIDGSGNVDNDPAFDQRDNLQEYDIRVQLDQSIPQGETVTIDWTARVTPKSDYQTTGLFVARNVSKYRTTSFTSGNGPFTIDLRGIVATQESWDPIVYTASSGDTSIVTANVQSDDYTLELTEQGTGTATITVTGEIPGVGTTQTTFEVTVE